MHDLRPTIEQVVGLLLAASLGMARPLGLALVMPVFTRMSIGFPIRAGFAMAISLPGLTTTLAAVRAAGPQSLRLGALGGKEIVVGIVIGLLFGIPFWGLQGAGETLDTQRSAPSSGSVDPSGGPISPAAGLLVAAASCLFVAAGGLGAIAATLYDSYAVWPIMRLFPQPAPGAGVALLHLLDRLTRIMVLAGAPIILAMLLADVAVILVGKAVPRLGIFDLAATLRNLVFVAGLALYGGFLMDYMGVEVAGLRVVGDELRTLLR